MPDDPNGKKRYDPLFDEIFKGILMPDLRPRERPQIELPKFEIVKHRPPIYAPMGVPSPVLDPLAVFPFEPKMSPEQELREMLCKLQLRLGPPEPTSPYDARLYAMAEGLGFKPVRDTQFGLDFKRGLLMMDLIAGPAERVLSLSHEIGHAQRMKEGKLKLEVFMEWNGGGRVHDRKLLRHIIQEELMAWRVGMKILRQLGCRFSDVRAVQHFRRMCLSTYRMATNQRIGAVRRLKIEGV